MKSFIQKDYPKQRPFANFLSGVAGTMGIPLWAFYVNRGQGIASFGTRDKNGMILEFYPGNLSYSYIPQSGFRTFVKVDGKVHEFFNEKNSNQTLEVRPDQFSIEETNRSLKLAVKVTYFTLPNEPIGALVRKVTLTNLSPKVRTIELADGLTQLLPSGIDYGGYKAISNLLQSWMQADVTSRYAFYRLRASTADSSQVSAVNHGNFYSTVGLKESFYCVDYKLIFEEDTSYVTPYGFAAHSYSALKQATQVHVNQVPCGYTISKVQLKQSLTFYSVLGHAHDENQLSIFLKGWTIEKAAQKEEENRQLHESIVAPIATETASEDFNAYLKQCYLDNVLRGGTPMMFDTLNGPLSYYVFSRKHGDLERDYNFFSIDPSYYSQGNGNFRDVLQNRRNDVLFHPEIGDGTIRQFMSMVQADGYNPLSIEGVQFHYRGKGQYPASIQALLQKPFTPGPLAMALEQEKLSVETTLKDIIAQSTYDFKAVFGEGYWEDHFTYLHDLFESYQAIYPDRMKELLFDTRVPFFVSPVSVAKREDKYVMRTDGQVRQYHAIHHDHQAPQSAWLKTGENRIEITLFGKLLTLALNKFAHLDPEGFGLSYEAERPGWNDAMNGLPGLFGSGVSEALELQKIIRFLIAHAAHAKKVDLLESTMVLLRSLTAMTSAQPFAYWEQRMTALETYREALKKPQVLAVISMSEVQGILEHMQRYMAQRLDQLKKKYPILPTYLIFKVTASEPILVEGAKKTSPQGWTYVRAKSFAVEALPPFLEAPARYLASSDDAISEKQALTQKIKTSGLYDKPLKIYQTSTSLEDWTLEIGRIRAFTPGWLERESNFLHMTYKYLLGLLKAGLIREYFEAIQTNLTCFMDPVIYGRSPYENSSFIAPSSNPDPKKHGQGFFARLSGSTAEVLSMWRYLFLGPQIFTEKDGQLSFSLKPTLPKHWFKKGMLQTTLFGSIPLIYHLSSKRSDTTRLVVERYELLVGNNKKLVVGSEVKGEDATALRTKRFTEIHAYLKEEAL